MLLDGLNKKFIFLFAAILLLPAMLAANEQLFLRGISETQNVGGVTYYALGGTPNEASIKTTVVQPAQSEVAELSSWFTGEAAGDFTISGPAFLYLSSIGISNGAGKYRWTVYDHNPSNGALALVAQSAWYPIPASLAPSETYANIQSYTFLEGHRAKLAIDYNATPGSTIRAIFDAGSSETEVYESSNGSTYTYSGVERLGVLTVNTSGTCTPGCSANSSCNDSDSSTIDTCASPGSCNASCQNISEENCPVACTSDSDCGQEGTCENAGTCNSSCAYNLPEDEIEPQPNTVSGIEILDCEAACSSDSQCNDGSQLTTDKCENAGTCNAYCSNTQCPLSCSNNDACDDSNPVTNDTCVNPGTCEAACNNVSCNPACSSNSECSDNDFATTDICAGAGRCTATCVNLATIGNGVCDSGESECSAPADCGSCGTSIGEFYEYACIGNSCRQTIKLGVCGNERCEQGEDFFTCESDCRPQQITIDANFSDSHYYWGENVRAIAKVQVDGREVPNATVRAEGFFGAIPIHNDGRHNDGTRNDNVYANELIIAPGTKAGLYPVKFTAEIGGVIEEKIALLNLAPKLSFTFSFNKDVFILGDNIQALGTIRQKNTPINVPVDFNFSRDGINVFGGTASPVNGEFTAGYRTTLIDEDGNYILTLSAMDANGNKGFIQKDFPVLSPDATNFLLVKAFALEESYSKGTSAKISALVKDISNNPVTGAQVLGTTAHGKFILSQTDDGNYIGEFLVPQRIPSGEMQITIDASEGIRRGSATTKFSVIDTNVGVEIIEPSSDTFLAGEFLQIRIRATYTGGEPMIRESVFVKVNNKAVELRGIDKGLYEGTYFVEMEDEGKNTLTIDIDDGFGNKADRQIDFEVSGTSYLFYLNKYGAQIAIAAIILLVVLIAGFSMVRKKMGLASLKKRERTILQTIKSVQTDYFVEGTLDKKSYDRAMEKYEAELQEIRQNIMAAQAKGKK
ncbi:MAG: hypothetical protein NUV67_00630 [archaeon]|nr:hypothetical protein [archaeon]